MSLQSLSNWCSSDRQQQYHKKWEMEQCLAATDPPASQPQAATRSRSCVATSLHQSRQSAERRKLGTRVRRSFCLRCNSRQQHKPGIMSAQLLSGPEYLLLIFVIAASKSGTAICSFVLNCRQGYGQEQKAGLGAIKVFPRQHSIEDEPKFLKYRGSYDPSHDS